MPTESEQSVDELLSKITKIEEILTKLDASEGSEIIEESRLILQQTQSHLDNNRSVIPSYCLKKATEALKRLEDRVSSHQKSSLQFKFRSKISKAAPVTTGEKLKPDLSQSSGNIKPFISPGITDRAGESIVLRGDQVNGKDVTLVNLTNCSVSVLGHANTVYLKHLTSTNVTVCLAGRAITAAECKDCDFKLVCQQLRIDSTYDSSFTTYVSTRSMLESSNGLIFKRLDIFEFDGMPGEQVEQLFVDSKFNKSENNWRMIDNFDCLSLDSSSKNYKIVE